LIDVLSRDRRSYRRTDDVIDCKSEHVEWVRVVSEGDEAVFASRRCDTVMQADRQIR
jgi:hypothetical protein